MCAFIAGVLSGDTLKEERVEHSGGDNFSVIYGQPIENICCKTVISRFSLGITAVHCDYGLRNSRCGISKNTGKVMSCSNANLAIVASTSKEGTIQNIFQMFYNILQNLKRSVKDKIAIVLRNNNTSSNCIKQTYFIKTLHIIHSHIHHMLHKQHNNQVEERKGVSYALRNY
jgi:hypothetical protein